MKKLNIALVVVLFLFTSCATIYQAPELSIREINHRTIAILPFDASIQYRKLPEDVSISDIMEMEEEMGYVFQNQMYISFLRNIEDYFIEFQDIDQTNTILLRNNVDYGNILEYSKDEIATMLEVDALVSGRVLSSKPMSTGGALALGILFGEWAATNRVDVTLSVHDGSDAKLLWKYDHSYSGSVGSNPESLSRELMRQIARKFPYRR